MERPVGSVGGPGGIVSELDFGIDGHPIPSLGQLWESEGCEGSIAYRLMVCSPFEKWVEDGGRDVSIASRLLDLVLFYATDEMTGAHDHAHARADQFCTAEEAIDWLNVDSAFNDLPPDTRIDLLELAALDDRVLRGVLDILLASDTPPYTS